ncbi:MAG: Zn-ribbon domain-containing OB-fold protein [Pseudomonadota bacterium]
MHPGNSESNDAFVTAYPELQPYWAAAAEQRLLLKFCKACGRTHWYPRVICPHCHGEDFDWKEASGFATVHSFSVVRRAAEPYVLAYVELDEGPVIMTNIIECDPREVSIGLRVQARFRAVSAQRWVPFFTIASGPQQG